MSRRKNDPLREITPEEHQALVQLSRSHVAPGVEVTRAKLLLALARGDDYQTATHPWAVAPATPPLTSSPASMSKAWPR